MSASRARPTATRLGGVLLFVVVFAGCVGFEQAVVPSSHLPAGWEEVDSGSGERWLGLAAEWAHVTYAIDPPRGTFDDGPYPASLQLMTVDTPGRLDRDDVSGKLEAQVRDNAAKQRLEIDEASRRSGERTLESGVRTLWFTYEARISSGSPLFDAGREARILGEVWFDEPVGATVVAVGLAQVQGGGTAGQYFTDRSSWEALVGDPTGSIEGVTGQGMVYGARMVDR